MHSEQGRAGKANQRGSNVQCTPVHCIPWVFSILLVHKVIVPVKFGFQPSISCLSNGSLVS